MNVGLMFAGLAVGLLVGLTGMGAGSLMTPLLITVFGIPAGTAVGTDLVYAAVTKTFGAARHTQLKNVNRELALWMATGSVPAAFLGTFMLYNVFGNINEWLPDVDRLRPDPGRHRGCDPHVRDHPRPVGRHEAARPTARSRATTRSWPPRIGAVFGFILGPHLGRLGRLLRHGARHRVPALGPARGGHRPVPRHAGDDRRRRRHDHLGHPRLRRTSARS